MPCWRPAAFAVALIVLLAPATAGRASAELTLAAASDLQTALPTLVSRFEASTGERVRVSYGSSGQFVSQIRNGAPFDLFLSADTEYAQQLVDSGHAVAGSLTPYASGRLVLWARRDRGLDIGAGLRGLLDPRVRRIAIANPEHAPYGRAAVGALRNAGLFEALQPRLVLGENVSQAAQFVQSGNADAGILARSLALSPALDAVGLYSEIPVTMHPPLRQAAVILSSSSRKDVAARFVAFLREPASAKVLQTSGFEAVP